MIEKYISKLACPKCQGVLYKTSNKLVCRKCKSTYVINKSIPVLLVDNSTFDVDISKEKWEVLYKSHSIAKSNTRNPMIVSQEKFLSNYTSDIKKGLFLDLGCGIAWQSYFLARKKIEILGIDISYEAVAKSSILFGKEKLPGLFVQGDFLHIPLKDKSVDFVYWGLAMEYVKETDRAIGEVYRILKPGKKVVSAFPPFSLSTLIYHQFRGGDIPRIPVLQQIMEFIHVTIFRGKYMHYGYGQTFTTSAIRKLFLDAGFRDVKIGYYDTYYPITPFPKIVRPLLRSLLKLRIFWPFAYVEAAK